jgi:hypothetical protein
MAARLLPIPKVYDKPPEAKVKKLVKAPAKRAVQLRIRVPVDEQYEVHSWFSEAYGVDAAKTFSEPLELEDLAAAAGQDFYWKVEIAQHRVDPLLQGFRVRFELDLAPGWTFNDSRGAVRRYEAISNPLSVKAVIKAPGSITTRPKFRVVIEKEFRP